MTLLGHVKATLNPFQLKSDWKDAKNACQCDTITYRERYGEHHSTSLVQQHTSQRVAYVAFAVLKTLALLGIGAVITFAVLKMTPFLIGAGIGVGVALILAGVASYGRFIPIFVKKQASDLQ